MKKATRSFPVQMLLSERPIRLMKLGKVFHESVNDRPVGRNVKEYLRLIDAYAHVQKHGEVCPAKLGRGQEG